MRGRLLAAATSLALLASACKTTSPGGPNDHDPDASAADTPDADPGEETCDLPQGATSGKRLRLVYLIPSDKEADPEVLAALEGAVRHVQLWLSARMPDGTSFRISEPPVEVSAVAHPADYYATNDPGGEPDQRFWFNVTADAFEATGGSFDDPDNVWLYYIDADAGCGHNGQQGPTGIRLHRGEDLPPDHVGPGSRHPAARAANANPLPHGARRQTKLMVCPQPRRIRRKP